MNEVNDFRILPPLAILSVGGYGECLGKAKTVRTFSDEAIAGGNTFVSIKDSRTNQAKYSFKYFKNISSAADSGISARRTQTSSLETSLSF